MHYDLRAVNQILHTEMLDQEVKHRYIAALLDSFIVLTSIRKAIKQLRLDLTILVTTFTLKNGKIQSWFLLST